jgi:hypothetical protein
MASNIFSLSVCDVYPKPSAIITGNYALLQSDDVGQLLKLHALIP